MLVLMSVKDAAKINWQQKERLSGQEERPNKQELGTQPGPPFIWAAILQEVAPHQSRHGASLQMRLPAQVILICGKLTLKPTITRTKKLPLWQLLVIPETENQPHGPEGLPVGSAWERLSKQVGANFWRL